MAETISLIVTFVLVPVVIYITDKYVKDDALLTIFGCPMLVCSGWTMLMASFLVIGLYLDHNVWGEYSPWKLIGSILYLMMWAGLYGMLKSSGAFRD